MSWSFLKYNYIFITNLTRKFYLSQAIIQRSAKVLLLLLFRPFLNTSSWKLPYGTSAFVQGLRSTCIVNRRFKLLKGHKNWLSFFQHSMNISAYMYFPWISHVNSREYIWMLTRNLESLVCNNASLYHMLIMSVMLTQANFLLEEKENS